MTSKAKELAEEISKIEKLIEASRIILNKGAMIDIEHLSVRILNICDQIPLLSGSESKAILPNLEKAIINLEVFSAEVGIVFDSYSFSDIKKKDKIA